MTPRTTYNDIGDGVAAIVTAIRGLQEKIQAQGMQQAFWDVTRDGNRVAARHPKREADIHPTLAGLLADAAVVRNIEIVRERPTGAGKLDFAFLAPLAAGGFARVCAEFKSAHSADLERGLTTQLPEYMQSEGAEFGVYGVLWFRSADFDKPSEYQDTTALELDLAIAKRQAGVRDIRVMSIDVSPVTPPSKRTSR